ncbi:MAG: hypothetical protein KAQ62_18445, partial [Cyclobacteriaceae bacterium]|nr:hypothetical protein [Cyclobacteriaceae bacterium]
ESEKDLSSRKLKVMKDELKKFTDQNRDSFDSYKLDLDEAWSGIDDKLNEIGGETVKFPWINVLKIAATIVVVMAVGFGFYINSQRIEISNNGIALHNISSELADTEAFYTAQIAETIKLIEVSAGGIEPEVRSQIMILDEEYMSLRNDLKDNADSEEVINAMIEYYRLKLAMLERILEELQKDNDNKDHEEILAV